MTLQETLETTRIYSVVGQLTLGESCRRFRDQIETLRATLASKLRESGALPSIDQPSLSNDARERIKVRLHDEYGT